MGGGLSLGPPRPLAYRRHFLVLTVKPGCEAIYTDTVTLDIMCPTIECGKRNLQHLATLQTCAAAKYEDFTFKLSWQHTLDATSARIHITEKVRSSVSPPPGRFPLVPKITHLHKFHSSVQVLGPVFFELGHGKVQPWLHVSIEMYDSGTLDFVNPDIRIVTEAQHVPRLIKSLRCVVKSNQSRWQSPQLPQLSVFILHELIHEATHEDQIQSRAKEVSNQRGITRFCQS